MQKADWPHQDLWDQGPLGPDTWLLRYGLDVGLDLLSFDEPLGNITQENIVQFRKQLFVNQGWRLTPTGTNTFKSRYNLYKSQHKDNEIMTGRVLLGMDNAIKGPWAYHGITIVVFDQITHFELEMVGGSAKSFVEFKQNG